MQPGASPSGAPVSFAEPRPVLEMRRAGNLNWYRIAPETGREGWVSSANVEPRHRIPAVHMLAGIYRLGAGQNERAEREFRAFLATAVLDPEETSERLTAAAALQLIALARARTVRSDEVAPEVAAAIERSLDEAQRLTPFDPGLWALRAALRLVIAPRRPEPALEALHRALALNPDQADVRSFSESLSVAARQRPDQLARLGLDPLRVANLLARLPEPGTPPQ